MQMQWLKCESLNHLVQPLILVCSDVLLGLKRIFSYWSYVHPCLSPGIRRVSTMSSELHLTSSLSFSLQLVTHSRRQCRSSGVRSAQTQWADPQDMSGVLRWGLGMPLWSCNMWELQGVLQEGCRRSVWHACTFRSSISSIRCDPYLDIILTDMLKNWVTIAYSWMFHLAATGLCRG